MIVDEFGGGVVNIVDGFEGELAGDTVGFVVGRGLEGGGPALGGVDEFGQSFADVAVVGTVVVEVVVELVSDKGDLFEEIVSILLAPGAVGFGVHVLDGFDAGIHDLDEEHDAIVGIVGYVAELLDLGVREGGLAAPGRRNAEPE